MDVGRERAVQRGRLGPEEHQRGQRGERGELARPAVVGHQQRSALEHGQQMAHGTGVAGQIDAVLVPAVRHDTFGQRLGIGQTDQPHRIAVGQQGITQLFVIFGRPGADGQDAAVGIDQHQLLADQHGEVLFQLRDLARHFALLELQQRRRGDFTGHAFGERAAAAFDGLDHGEELLRQMLVGVVQHLAVHERTAIQAFLRVRFEADAHFRAGQVGEDAADAGEQFAVDHHVEIQRTHLADRLQAVPGQISQRLVVESDDVFARHHAQQVEHFAVLAEHQHVQLDAGITPLEFGEHRLRQHQATHLGQQHDQDAARLGHFCRRDERRLQSLIQRQGCADGYSGQPVDSSLEIDIQWMVPCLEKPNAA